ncbi:MAG: DUF3667 domain-containing protein [Aquabacterium sp.]
MSTEGALWRTLALLLLRPGELTRRYLAGQRKHYVLPLRLYLTISVIVLLAVRLFAQGGITVDLDTEGEKAVAAKPRQASISIGTGTAGTRDGAFYCENLPAWVCKRLKRRIDVDESRVPQMASELGERILSNLGAAMFVLLPGFALWLKLAYRNRRLRYTEHLVFALHVHAFWFTMLGLALVDWQPLSLAVALAVPIYTLLAMRRVYGGRWWPMLGRSMLVSTLYGITLVAALTGLGLWAVLA